jgi:predicted TPR repeat methyltransferase
MTLQPVRRSTGDDIADRRYAYAAAAFDEGDLHTAFDMTVQTLELAPGFAPAYALLGRIELGRGQREAAIAAFREALALEPEDAMGIGLELARLNALPAGGAMTGGYVKALFDQYAERFDTHLTGALHYRGPAVIRAALDAAGSEWMQAAQAIDLGCGTGLMAGALEGYAGTLTGVDLSPQMLARARATGRYAALHEADAVSFLDAQPDGAADLILAADVVVYIGDLFPLMREVARVLAAGGRFAFTAQAAHGHGFQLGADNRYAHSDEYLRTVAADAGLSVAHIASASTRQDRGIDVPGLVLVLRKA